MRSLGALRGTPAIALLWSSDVAGARTALETLERGAGPLLRAGVGSIAIAVDTPPSQRAPGNHLHARRRWSAPRVR
jgi:hypothetical protein